LSRYQSEFMMGFPRCVKPIEEESFVVLQISPSMSSFTGWHDMISGASSTESFSRIARVTQSHSLRMPGDDWEPSHPGFER
jgi:hypothetical protein